MRLTFAAVLTTVTLILCQIAAANAEIDDNLETAQLAALGLVAPPLPRELFPSEFTERNRQTWMAVPAWLAGTWHAQSQLIVRAYDYRQHKITILDPVKVAINRRSTIGSRMDSSGQVWHYLGCPYVRSIETPGYLERQLIEDIRLLSIKPDEVIMQTHATISQLEKNTLQLASVFVEETTTTYRPAGKNKIEVSFLVVDYDVSGSPLKASKSYCIEQRVKPFRQVDADERGNLKMLFSDFQKRSKR